ncbi:methyl-accepting chemotaxis protein [Sporosarcina sp. Sa2YVA2]|uniref:Methyl-accepting chemotaxis protein n=1 Tax=Sporosarcina quadrami TaxID=2762234 RepID=A0ABR8UAU0_9BACL|nr:methyl-accepting chemotaxis protein [Sporosarcina quadrami]MBD7985145.1 methyl-accepting chemotaxis protein [Sporosarcina quadrami]
MFKSIKTKIIFTTIALFLIGILLMSFMINDQVKKRSVERVIGMSNSTVEQTTSSIENFLDQYTRGIGLFAQSKSIPLYTGKIGNTSQEKELVLELKDFLSVFPEASTAYYSTVDNKSAIYPEADLTNYDATSRPWFTKAIATPEKVQWSEPYIDNGTGDFVITASKAVSKNGKIIGVTGVDIMLTQLTNELSANKLPFDGYTILLDEQGVAISHPTKSGENLMDLPHIQEVFQNESGDVEFTDDDGHRKIDVYTTIPEFGWKVAAVFEKEKLMSMANEIRTSMIIIALITIIIVSVAMYIVIARIIKPIGTISSLMDSVATGDLTVQSDIKTKDEIGLLGDNFNKMIANMKGIIAVVSESAVNVRSNSENLSAVAEETNASSAQVAHAVSEIAEGASQSAEDAENVSERTEHLGDEINDINIKAGQMTDIAERTSIMNANGQKQMIEMKETFVSSGTKLRTMSEAITTLGDKVKAIGGVMETITEISAQTNLLALNASIEAARAGEHGKGFAVVADEVRKLAEQSSKATEDVKVTVLELQEESKLVAVEMNDTIDTFRTQGHVVEETETSFKDLSNLMNEMQLSIDSITQEIYNVTKNKDDVAMIVQTMAATSEETAAACEEVSASTEEQLHAIQSVTEAAETLTDLSEELTNTINQFKI